MGANTAVFSLINGLLLRPLPVPHAEQLAVLRIEEDGPQPELRILHAVFPRPGRKARPVPDVFAYNGDTLQVRGDRATKIFTGMLVSGQFFQRAGNTAVAGALSDSAGRPREAVRQASRSSSAKISGKTGSTARQTWSGAR